MRTTAVVFEAPERLALAEVGLNEAVANDVVVDVEWSGISTGTERLLWSGRMPPFPGMGYPLVPGYETVGRVREAGHASGLRVGQRVFVPGARCFSDVRGLFGGAAAQLVVPADRAVAFDERLGERGILLALAATAQHALDTSARAEAAPTELIVGHGVLGRLMARLAVAAGESPTVWEVDAERAQGASGYRVIAPQDDPRRDYRRVIDASGDAGCLDTLIARLAPKGEVVLAGFYEAPLAFAFPPAFMREARIAVAAEWNAADLEHVRSAAETGVLDLDGLITHREPASRAESAYRIAFGDRRCLKMILDWRSCA